MNRYQVTTLDHVSVEVEADGFQIVEADLWFRKDVAEGQKENVAWFRTSALIGFRKIGELSESENVAATEVHED